MKRGERLCAFCHLTEDSQQLAFCNIPSFENTHISDPGFYKGKSIESMSLLVIKQMRFEHAL